MDAHLHRARITEHVQETSRAVSCAIVRPVTMARCVKLVGNTVNIISFYILEAALIWLSVKLIVKNSSRLPREYSKVYIVVVQGTGAF